MNVALVVSFVLHVGILAWAYLAIQSTPHLSLPEAPTIEAELITIAEFTRLKQGDPNAKKLEAKAKKKKAEPKVAEREAPKPKPESKPPPPAQEPPPPPEDVAKKKEPEPAPVPKPDPIADKLAALTPPPPPSPSALERKKLEVERKKQAKKQAAAKAKKKSAERKRKELEAEKKRKADKKRKAKDFKQSMRALLDKTPEKRGAPLANVEPTTPTDYTGPTAGEREGSGNQLTAREEDLLKGQISAQLRGCWRLPGGGGGTETPIVTLKWSLRADGSLSSTPQIEGGARSGAAFKVAAENAIRAVVQCAPFDLPPDLYASWKTIIWDFDPRHML